MYTGKVESWISKLRGAQTGYYLNNSQSYDDLSILSEVASLREADISSTEFHVFIFLVQVFPRCKGKNINWGSDLRFLMLSATGPGLLNLVGRNA